MIDKFACELVKQGETDDLSLYLYCTLNAAYKPANITEGHYLHWPFLGYPFIGATYYVNVRGHALKIWLSTVQYLHFRVLKFHLMESHLEEGWDITRLGCR